MVLNATKSKNKSYKTFYWIFEYYKIIKILLTTTYDILQFEINDAIITNLYIQYVTFSTNLLVALLFDFL